MRKHTRRAPKRFGLVKALLAFAPMRKLLEDIRDHGTVDAERGVPVMADWDGDACQIVPALIAWCDNWDRIARGEGVPLTTTAQRRIGACLQFDRPIFPQEVAAAIAELDAQYRAYLTLPAAAIDGHVRTTRIEIAMDELRENAQGNRPPRDGD